MTQFKNSPRFENIDGENKIKRYTHQPLTIEHYGVHAKIQENGKVIISSQPEKDEGGELVWDEVEVPASLIFKLANLLKDTRVITYVSVNKSE